MRVSACAGSSGRVGRIGRPTRRPPTPIRDHPEVAKAVVNLVRKARAAGVDVQPLHYVVDLAYYMGAVGLAYTAEGEG